MLYFAIRIKNLLNHIQDEYETCLDHTFVHLLWWYITTFIGGKVSDKIRLRYALILSAAVTDSPAILLFPSPWQHPYHLPASSWQSQGFVGSFLFHSFSQALLHSFSPYLNHCDNDSVPQNSVPQFYSRGYT